VALRGERLLGAFGKRVVAIVEFITRQAEALNEEKGTVRRFWSAVKTYRRRLLHASVGDAWRYGDSGPTGEPRTVGESALRHYPVLTR
jgi:hypothetical protein